jgi:hypothetical protein
MHRVPRRGLLCVFTVGNMLALLTKCPYWAFAFGHGVWSAAKGDLSGAIIILENWKSTLCQAPDECPNRPIFGSIYCYRHGGQPECTSTDCNGTAFQGDTLCISCGGGPRCTFIGCKSGCSGDRGDGMLCFTHGGSFSCYVRAGCKSFRIRELGYSTQFCVNHQLLDSRPERAPFQTFHDKQAAFVARVEGWRG